jgi:hypothetical protein
VTAPVIPTVPVMTTTPRITGTMPADMNDDLGTPYIGAVTDANLAKLQTFLQQAAAHVNLPVVDRTPVPVTIGTGSWVLDAPARLWQTGRIVELWARVERTGYMVSNDFGVVPASHVLTVTDVTARPSYVVNCTFTRPGGHSLHGYIGTDGRVTIRGCSGTSAVYAPGAVLTLCATWMLT